MEIIRSWFKVEGGVPRRFYILTGVSLMLAKYGIDNLILWLVNGHFISPQSYLLPLIKFRELLFTDTPLYFPFAFLLWCLPFAFIGGNMSMRRARDAGLPAWTGLLFFVPFLNFLVMIVLSVAPSRTSSSDDGDLDGAANDAAQANVWESPEASELELNAPNPSAPIRPQDAVFAILIWQAIATAMLGFTVYGLGSYGAALFIGSPFLMGFAATVGLNRRRRHSMRQTSTVLALSCLITAGLFLSFALEGLICILMAAPLVFAAGLAGAKMAHHLGKSGSNIAAVLALSLPLMGFVESPALKTKVRPVRTSIIVHANPNEVWPNVIGFSEIKVPRPWYFHSGIAVPLRARIEGEGVGATRHCEFTTGSFVEPITVWNPPHRLAFSVLKQPPTMEEWSPYAKIAPPHLEHNVLRSRRGEFLLETLPDSKTRLTGTTWYTFDMAPTWYWNLWGDVIIHRIHERVLTHVALLSESNVPE
jgi:uncharacterized membrane protein YhaH (DUF805 family)